MTDLKLPELNCVMLSGNLTRDPIFRKTTHGAPVVNFTVAVNRRYRDSNNQWQEEASYIGVVAWNTLAESCVNRLKRGSSVLVEGELQSHTWRTTTGPARTTVEIKARRIQFLSKAIHAEIPRAESFELHNEHLEEYIPLDDQADEQYSAQQSSNEKGE
ncbi:MAG TPA: single-stranded DNA-binding protein [Bacteroidetes bacterium]|jgi:single-strand DNA-binding protein|nr:single-stranded DNA-binding protein [Bacteroidota bacterium]